MGRYQEMIPEGAQALVILADPMAEIEEKLRAGVAVDVSHLTPRQLNDVLNRIQNTPRRSASLNITSDGESKNS